MIKSAIGFNIDIKYNASFITYRNSTNNSDCYNDSDDNSNSNNDSNNEGDNRKKTRAQDKSGIILTIGLK